ncbi:MAG: hypothetical protein AAGH15_14225, partial [Myxococcota bacterium]
MTGPRKSSPNAHELGLELELDEDDFDGRELPPTAAPESVASKRPVPSSTYAVHEARSEVLGRAVAEVPGAPPKRASVPMKGIPGEAPKRVFERGPSEAPEARESVMDALRRGTPEAIDRRDVPLPSPEPKKRVDPRGEGTPTAERVAPTELTAIGTATEPPPPMRPGLSPVERAWRLVVGLRSCGPNDEGAAVQALLNLGKPGLDAVAKDFPGLLWFHRNLVHRKVPRGRDTSPLARALVAFGEDAVPAVADLIEHDDANRRYYASLVAADLLASKPLTAHGRRCLADALFHRLEDVDVGVRDMALQGLLALEGDAALRSIVSELRRRALAIGPIGSRLLALRALGVLRAVDAIDDLIRLLGDTSLDVQVAAR